MSGQRLRWQRVGRDPCQMFLHRYLGERFAFMPIPLLRPLLRAITGRCVCSNQKAGKISSKIFKCFPYFPLLRPIITPLHIKSLWEKKRLSMYLFFYCDVTEALAALEKTQADSAKATEGVDLKLIPFPLEQAFKLWCDDKAVIIPSKASILQAGAPAGTNPIGQRVPMWACLDIAEEQEGGLQPKLPIFMGLEDANAAVLEAVGGDRSKAGDLEVVCLSLDGAIEQLVSPAPEESPSFAFIPPTKSMIYIEENNIA
uniref:Uncharacterized protein n=1 Tax=Pseudo-nitzschia australis TaxID=44445 RepID=A0A7S4A8Y9_9STRA|mmetsp:Transcript_26310/g.57625  ORF Transcript_26310/g.57625 Transcript_26310/m.57625 type:complete len:257 (+) Transcript_26310:212-982(+)